MKDFSEFYKCVDFQTLQNRFSEMTFELQKELPENKNIDIKDLIVLYSFGISSLLLERYHEWIQA